MTGFVKKQVGVVISNKMKKTVVVQTTRKVLFPLFNRYFPKRKKFKVHDEKGQCHVGDVVSVVESKPISKEKRWIVSEVLKKGEVY